MFIWWILLWKVVELNLKINWKIIDRISMKTFFSGGFKIDFGWVAFQFKTEGSLKNSLLNYIKIRKISHQKSIDFHALIFNFGKFLKTFFSLIFVYRFSVKNPSNKQNSLISVDCFLCKWGKLKIIEKYAIQSVLIVYSGSFIKTRLGKFLKNSEKERHD